jgi:hypothetical protein
MGGRNKICIRYVAENLKERGDLRHVVEGTQTLKILGCGVDLYDSGWKN